jgi:putative ABC transport system ATP-binding protein
MLGCLAAPSTGQILIGDQNVSRMSDDELAAFRAQSLGFIFQNFNLLPVLTALENVEYALLERAITAEERRALAMKALKEVGLGDRAGNRPDQLSGGQRQRVAIARAFVREPKLIIADEPTANLDRHTALEILELMGKMNERTGSTVIMATHDPVAISKARRRVDIVDGVLK